MVAAEKRFIEELGDVRLVLTRHRGLPGTRRWSGYALAEWGSVSGSSHQYRTRRAARNSMSWSLMSFKPGIGPDVERTLADAKEGLRDFRNRDLGGLDLRGMSLRRANFSNTFLARASLQQADLQGSRFKCANVYRADLTGANLAHSVLTATAFCETNLTGANLRGVSHAGKVEFPPENPQIRMEGWAGWLYFVDCDLSDSDFEGAKLPEVFFKRCDLSRATFRGADLQGARILDCEIDGTLFEDARMIGAYVGTPRDDERDDQWF